MSEVLNELGRILTLPAQRVGGFVAIRDALSAGSGPRLVEAYGSWGSLGRVLAAWLAGELGRPLVYVTGHVPHADQAQDDLETLLARPVMLLPASETTDDIEPDPAGDIACERLRICQELQTRISNLESQISHPVVVASMAALMQPLPGRDHFRRHTLTLTSGGELPGGMEGLLAWLTDHGFSRTDQVDVVGDYAARGGIMDIFSPTAEQPLRVEFFGDDIESIRRFDLDTKRSAESLPGCTLTGLIATPTADRATLLDYLPADTLVVLEEAVEVAELGRTYRDRLLHPQRVFAPEVIFAELARFDTLQVNRFVGTPEQFNTRQSTSATINLHAQSVQRYEHRGLEALRELSALAATQNVWLMCENPAQKQRAGELADCTPMQLPVGLLHQGFELPELNLLLISHHELFGQQQPLRRVRRLRNIQAIDSFTDLEPGDLVVHVSHGIAKYLGMKAQTKNNRQQEFLALEFADKALLHVPAENIHLVHKYVGALGRRPKLSRLGSASWAKAKQRVAAAVEDMASYLIDLQAARQTHPGVAYPPDSTWQKEFEAAFGYQDTDDQITASAEIKADLQSPRPMDRLLCGDVGYGKTELAIRAAFKVAESGRQVAVLVPTTVLADQHYRTFCDRMADFPLTVEVISRFKTAGQARGILARTAAGQVDILIGTHRILSGDVHFKDLGLVVIDEEQRFGVEHKERLKYMRETVEVLTMTATPIPRTLHLALLGIRDISSLSTPPLDRRSIVTEVRPYDRQLIRQAILRELAREGQVFYLHNRVGSIFSTAAELRDLVPEARFVVGHGQMPRHELEACMLTFTHRRADVLVCTTIIESGLDIPNANTIIIADADRFGLAELHQLRGRVGRYKHRAYAYMLLPARRAINPTATRRLKAIEEYSQLGSGFRIAMRDLEIRGAGNILGVEQSGHIDLVGYELYCQLLASAVRRQQQQPEPAGLLTHLELDIDSNIPRGYIPSDRQRMEVYRRLATCRRREELDQLQSDLTDQFGQPPAVVRDLLGLAEIRVAASRWEVRSIVQKAPDLIFTFERMTLANALFAHAPGRVSMPDPDTIYLRLPDRHFKSPSTILTTLRKLVTRTPSPLLPS